jgi:hypothetical protein
MPFQRFRVLNASSRRVLAKAKLRAAPAQPTDVPKEVGESQVPYRNGYVTPRTSGVADHTQSSQPVRCEVLTLDELWISPVGGGGSWVNAAPRDPVACAYPAAPGCEVEEAIVILAERDGVVNYQFWALEGGTWYLASS